MHFQSHKNIPNWLNFGKIKVLTRDILPLEIEEIL